MNGIKPLIAVAALFTILIPAGLWAAEDDPTALERSKVKERIKLIKMWKLIDILDLDEARAQKIFPVIQRFDAQREEIHDRHNENIRALRAALEAETPNDADLTKLIERMLEERNALVRAQTEEIEALRGMLSVQELGKLILFQDEFRKEIHKIISESRRGRRGLGRKGPGSDQTPPPPGDF
ncbi:hypothetical protein ACFL4G_07400 [Thermodesulfobacteriota bacterium]